MNNLLVRLELQGYKTFASKTVFDFPGRVTAIVGPNGSGKSNIADAIRWVLGEQAYSLLRGKKTVDMIFFGSEQRSRASMASASITFNNETGWLPVDFSEVTIIRRAYRNGENEYLINNQKVRLKEINELLANSGLGERTYTIIGQGLVDSALSQRPEERRRFFEEAAGIKLYQGRREEAVQKLDKTLRNMERVTDILGELGPRMSSLEKSLEKTRQYNQVHANLEALLKDWYGFQLHQARNELKGAVNFHNAQKEKLSIKKTEKEEIEACLNQVHQSVNLNRNKLANYHKELAALHSRKEELTRENAVLDERNKSLENRISELNSTLSQSKSRLNRENSIKEELTDRDEKLNQEHNAIVQKLAEAEKNLQEAMDANAKIENELSIIRNRIFQIETQIVEKESQRKSMQADLDRSKEELLVLRENIQKLKTEHTNEKQLLKDQESALEKVEDSIIAKNEELRRLKKEHQKLKDTIGLSRGEFSGLETDLTRIQTQLSVIQEDEKNLTDFNSGSAQLLDAKSIFEGGIYPVINHINIPAQYEIAVAAALGEILEGVIADKNIQPVQILDFIEQHQSSRTVIIPERWIESSNEHLTDSEHLLIASTVISGERTEIELIKNLLSRTIIAESREQALELKSSLRPGWRIVTLNGELFDYSGFVTAGYEKRSVPLRRKRNKQGLLDEKANVDKQIVSLESVLAKLVDSENQISGQIEELVSSIDDEEKAKRELSLQIYKKRIEIEQKAQNIENGNIRHSNALNQILDFEQKINMLGVSIQELQRDKQLKESKEEEIRSQLDTTKIDEFRQLVVDLNSEEAVSSQVIRQHRQRVEDNQKEIEESVNRIDEILSKIQSLNSEGQTVKDRKSSLMDENKKIQEKIDALNIAIQPLEEEVDLIIGQQGKILDEVDAKRQTFAIAERHAMQSQMKVERATDHMESIRTKIEEDMGFIIPAMGSDYASENPLPFDEWIARLPVIHELPEGLEDQIKQEKSLLRRIGPVNPEAEKEFNDLHNRFEFLKMQLHDLEEAEKDLRHIVEELDAIMKKEFSKTFDQVKQEFKNIFSQLFNGGVAELYIEDPQDIFNSGIEIEATLPGKRRQELALLSGGERSLAAVALIFALLRISPTPFCVLDEVDAMLDESNVVRFGELLRELSEATQFIVITHNRNTVQLADVLYGVTMGKDSVSQVISLRLDELTNELVE